MAELTACARPPLAEPAPRFAWLPFGALLIALAAIFLVGGDDDGRFHRNETHYGNSAKNMAVAANASVARGFLFIYASRRDHGGLRHLLYNRFPMGGFLLIKLAITPFDGDLSAQLRAARWLMRLFFCAAAVCAYLGVVRITRSPAIALAATLLAFSSLYLLDYSDIVSNEVSVDLFAVALVFHGLVVFVQRRRFAQLLVKVCLAALLGWHALALALSFVVLGAVGAAIRRLRGWVDKGRAGAGAGTGCRLAKLLASTTRSRYLALAVAVALCACGVFGWNIAREHAALDGQRAFAELPSVRSALRRVGAKNHHIDARPDLSAWPAFAKWQLHRVGTVALPVAAHGLVSLWSEDALDLLALGEPAWRASGAPSLALWGAVATAAAFAGLLLLPRHRLPMASLALCGFCWAWLVRGTTMWPSHDYESVFFFGVPLAMFAGLGLLTRRLLALRLAATGGALAWRAVRVAFGGVAMAAFVWAAWRVNAMSDDAEVGAERTAMMAEFDAVRALTRGKDVLVARRAGLGAGAPGARLVENQNALYYYMADSVLVWDRLTAPRAEADGVVDYVLSFESLGESLTPGHRYVFLYEAGGVLERVVQARRRDYARLAGRAPAARSVWTAHLAAGDIVLLKEPCEQEDADGRFFWRALPLRRSDLPLPNRAAGFEQASFYYGDAGLRFEDKCLLRVPLPAYPIARLRVGQYALERGPLLWETVFRTDIPRLRRALKAARAAPPAARAVFDVYWQGATLVYVRAPCAPTDTAARFFLHVRPQQLEDLDKKRRRNGFDNLDFDFNEQGARVDGACVARVELPRYAVAGVRTGQWLGGGEVWSVALDAKSKRTAGAASEARPDAAITQG